MELTETMRPEIKDCLQMSRNPMSNIYSLNKLKEKLSWYDKNSMKQEELQAINEIYGTNRKR